MRSALFAAFALVVALSGEATAGSLGTLYPQLVYTSDYRFNGLSNSNNAPTIQATLYLWRPDGFYSGITALAVDYGFPGGPTFEVDIYGGRKFQAGRVEVSFEAMGSFFPDQSGPGPTLNFYQVKTAFKVTEGPLTFGSATTWSPEGSYASGETSTLTGHVKLKVTDWLDFGGQYGTHISNNSQDRKFWDVGATAKWQQIAINIRYVDTDLERHQCFHSNWCEPSLVGTIAWNVPIFGFSEQ